MIGKSGKRGNRSHVTNKLKVEINFINHWLLRFVQVK